MQFSLRSEDITFVDRAPVVVRVETIARAAPAKVWPAFADARLWVEWFAGMKDAHYTSPEPHGVGSTRHVHVQGFKVDETILAFDEGKRFAFRVDRGNLPVLAALVEVITLEAIDGGTRVVYRQALEAKSWFRPLVPMMRRQMQRGLEAGLAGLDPWVQRRAGATRAPSAEPARAS